MPKDNYPLHPGQTHADPLYAQIPLEEYEALMKENKALKQANKNLIESVAELKQKLEDVQASMYADVVDANMENRRLRRALWIARAEWARSSALSYHLIESHPDKDVSATYKRKANKWEKAKDKCLKKAEEYK
jgi:cell division septum initiation protein DivIVA